jgi:competence protein ComEC
MNGDHLMRFLYLCSIVYLCLIFTPVSAELVTLKPFVTGTVNIRAAASVDSMAIGSLGPGQMLPHVASVPFWHEIQLPNGQKGFIAKRLTEVIDEPVDVAESSDFAIHFLDVGVGDSIIVDIGDFEIVIDGGNYSTILNRYARHFDLIQGPIELVVVTHGDHDHWKGLERLLGIDGVEDEPYEVLEYWDPGYNRDCNPPNKQSGRKKYLAFVDAMKKLVGAENFKRPLEDIHTPPSKTDAVSTFSLAGRPDLQLTVLNSQMAPVQASCSFMINNASIVMMLEIGEFRFLLTGDANGKELADPGNVDPKYVEKMLLSVENQFPGTLKADVLKAPHHGSESASTVKFIDAVDPEFVIFSASTSHHLPKASVVARYDNGERILLQTDEQRRADNDHIICVLINGELECNFFDTFSITSEED